MPHSQPLPLLRLLAIMDDYKMPMGTADGMRYTGISANSLFALVTARQPREIGSHLNSPKNISSNLTKAKGRDSPTSSTVCHLTQRLKF